MTTDRGTAQRRGGSFGGGVMLLIGLLAGVALTTAAGVFLLGIGWATPIQALPVISTAPSPTVSVSVSVSEPPASGEVPDSCVRSAEYNLEVDEALDDLAKGAEAQDARLLQETLDRLQDARDTAEGASEKCLAQAGKSPETSASTSPAPSPTQTS